MDRPITQAGLGHYFNRAPVSLRCERNGGGVGDGDEGGSGGSDGDLITSILVGLVVGFWVVVGPLLLYGTSVSKAVGLVNGDGRGGQTGFFSRTGTGS
ncbi:hypothetical protein R6Q59_014926 [Mikania micrantha]